MAQDLVPKKIGILGPGAIGGLLAGLLYRSGYQVYCYGTEPTVELIHRNGIQIKSSVFGDFCSYPAVSLSASSPVDVLFITVKAPALDTSIASIFSGIGKNTAIVPLLNGIGHRERIRGALGSIVVVGTIGGVEASLGECGVVLHRTNMIPRIEMASDTDVSYDKVFAITSMVRNAGLSAAIGNNENEVIWKKLVRLSAIATMTSYTQSPIGIIRIDKRSRSLLEKIVEELCQIARIEGVSLSAHKVINQIDALPETLTTSMQRDISTGRLSEIESILGEPIRRGQYQSLSLPALEHCYSHIRSQLIA